MTELADIGNFLETNIGMDICISKMDPLDEGFCLVEKCKGLFNFQMTFN